MPGVPKELIEYALKVDPNATAKSNGYGVSHRTSEKPSKRRWRNYSQQGSSKKSTIPNGWPTLYSSRRRTITWELMSSPNLDLLEQLSHLESLFTNYTIHQLRYKVNKLLTRRPQPQSEKY